MFPSYSAAGIPWQCRMVETQMSKTYSPAAFAPWMISVLLCHQLLLHSTGSALKYRRWVKFVFPREWRVSPGTIQPCLIGMSYGSRGRKKNPFPQWGCWQSPHCTRHGWRVPPLPRSAGDAVLASQAGCPRGVEPSPTSSSPAEIIWMCLYFFFPKSECRLTILCFVFSSILAHFWAGSLKAAFLNTCFGCYMVC